MYPRPSSRFEIAFRLLVGLLVGGIPIAFAQQARTSGAKPGELSIARILAQPSLNGRLTEGIAWAPDSKRLSYFETKPSGKVSKTELWTIEPTIGKRSLLISAEKLEAILTTVPEESHATGAKPEAPVHYQWAPRSDALLFTGPHAIVWFDLKSQTAHVLVNGKDSVMDAKVSPDEKYVSFVRNHNLWLVTTADGNERPLTTGGSEEARQGEVDWVYRQEFDIFTGYWWSPDSSTIAYLEMDEREVPQFPLVDFESFTGDAELQRYPVPGSSNPLAHVSVVEIATGRTRQMDIGADEKVYIPRVQWLPDSKRLAIQRLDRTQTTLDLLLSDASTGESSTLLSQKDAYWINVSNDLYFLKDSKHFLWSDERTGYRHLYLYDFSGKQPVQLTTGDWEVSQLEAVDEAKGLAYFTATERSPLERHLYLVGLSGGGFKRITSEVGTHRVGFAPDAATYMDTYSNATVPPRQDFYRADGQKLATLNENKVAELGEYHLSPVEFFTIRSHDGVSLNCSMIKPPNFDPAKKYPVLVYTYGGPRVQVVLNAWGGSHFLWHQLMAQKGYIVFSLDNRGSAGRGHIFEEPIHYRFGAQELSDQRDGGRWLKAQPYVDGERIGVWGWGYGGQMTLHAMFEAAQIFRVGFAGAPVTDWRFYDTIFAERYIGLLPMHEDSYDDSSPIENAKKLKGKLLVAHGTGDEIVHYANTLALTNDLIASGKYVEVMTFPGRAHEIQDPKAQLLLWERVTQFFLDNL